MITLAFFRPSLGTLAAALLWLGPNAVAQIVPGESLVSLVGIKAARAETTEPSELTRIAPGEFVLQRSGEVSAELTVYLRYEGTAAPDEDYVALPKEVVFPAGTAEISLLVMPLDDGLVERDETVVAILMGPPAGAAAYRIQPEAGMARVVIHDNGRKPAAVVKITHPLSGASLVAGVELEVSAVAMDPEGYIPQLEFYLDGVLLEVSTITFIRAPDPGTPIHHSVVWKNPAPGGHDLVARGKDSRGNVIASEPARVTVTGARIEITAPRSGEQFRAGAEIPIRAVAVDPRGYIPRIEFYANDRRIGVSELAFLVAPEPGTPIDHFFVWQNAPAGEYGLYARAVDAAGHEIVSARVRIAVIDGTEGDRVVLAVEAADPVAAEMSATGAPDRGVFVIKRIAGRKDVDVHVLFELAGTAVNGVDYEEVRQSAMIPAGREAVEIVITPVPDKAIEPDETVELVLEPAVCPAIYPPPANCYAIGQPAAARVVIRGNSGGVTPALRVAVVRPRDGSVFQKGQVIEVRAETGETGSPMARLDVLADGRLLGSTKLPALTVAWPDAEAGAHILMARAVDERGVSGESAPVRILVERTPEPAAFVWRELPGGYVPGVEMTVYLTARPPRGTLAYAMEDRPPKGWRVGEVGEGGEFDAANGKVKFGVFTDDQARRLAYRVTPPATADGAVEFDGAASAGGLSAPIAGDRVLRPGSQTHPADHNADYVLTLDELTSYAAAWKGGENWAAGPSPIPLEYVTRAGLLWRRGEEYYYVASEPAPLCFKSSEDRVALRAAASIPERVFRSVRRLAEGPGLHCVIVIPGETGAAAWAVEEVAPPGWRAVEISDGGRFDAAGGVIRWGVFTDETARELRYTLEPMETSEGIALPALPEGRISFDGRKGAPVENARPEMPAVRMAAEGGVRLTLKGAEGQVCVLESSTDLVTWTEAGEVFLPDGELEFLDPETAANRQRYYRLRTR